MHQTVDSARAGESAEQHLALFLQISLRKPTPKHLHSLCASVALAVTCAAPLFTNAADEYSPIVTDRPTDAASPLLVAPGRFQIESGYKVTESDSGTRSTYRHLAPDLLLRAGITERLELRAFAPGWAWESGAGNTSGFSDISLGAKIHLAEENGLRPQSALLVEATLPTGSDELTADYTIPKVLFLGSHTLSDRWSLTYNAGPSFVTSKVNGAREERVEWNYALGTAVALDHGLTVFAEIFGAAIDDNRADDRRSLQAGATWLLSNRLQLDARAGSGLISSEPDWFVGFGVSLRFAD
jgi:hypothetical protein